MKNNGYKSVIIASILLGILVSIQFKVISLENSGMTTSKKGEQLALELKSLKKEEEALKSEIEEIKNNIDKYKGKESEDSKKTILSEIEKYEVLAGDTDVKGKGIEIIITKKTVPMNGDPSEKLIYNYDLLLSLLNKLNSAQANAISINGKRVVSNTYLHLKSDKLYMNNTEIKEPFVICAIGDPETLASALQIKYGIVWEIEKYYNASVSIEKKDIVKINRNSENIEYKHSITND